MSSSVFNELLHSSFPDIDSARLKQIDRYRELVLNENQKQNLTRILEPQAFLEGHILDCVQLLKAGFLKGNVLDIGSGAGVPGVVMAILEDRDWIITDSETKKAQFIEHAARILGLNRVQVFSERAEEVLKKLSAETVVARAVGPVSRIYRWIQDCSTWNNLILFKGPAWEQEWKEFNETVNRSKLFISNSHEYYAGSEKKRRLILKLQRNK